MVELTPRTYVVSSDNEDLNYIIKCCKESNDAFEKAILLNTLEMVEGLMFFEGDRIIVGMVDPRDRRLHAIERSLTRSGHWLNLGSFTDVVLGKPKRPYQPPHIR